MNDNDERAYWEQHAKNYDRSMALLGRPIPRMVELAGDLYALRFEPSSFDPVVAANVLHLVPDLPGTLAAFRQVLEPGGRLIVPTFCHDETAVSWVMSRVLAITGFPGHRRFTVASLRGSLEAAGLRVTRTETLPELIPIGYVEGSFELA